MSNEEFEGDQTAQQDPAFSAQSVFPTGLHEIELARIVQSDDSSLIWRLMCFSTGRLEIETNWSESGDPPMTPTMIDSKYVDYVYRVEPDPSLRAVIEVGDESREEAYRRISLAERYDLTLSGEKQALPEITSLLLDLVYLRLSEDRTSVLEDNLTPVIFESDLHPALHSSVVDLLERRVKEPEDQSTLEQVDMGYRPLSYWETKTTSSSTTPRKMLSLVNWDDYDSHPNEVDIASISAALWWDGEQVGLETSLITAYRLDDEYDLSHDDLDDEDGDPAEDRIHYRLISSSWSPVDTHELGYSDKPLTLEELIDLIYPRVEDAWDSWFTPEDHLVQHIQFCYSSDFYPQLGHVL